MICARATLLLSGIGLALAAIPAATSAQTVAVYAESAGDALARNVRTLADRPKDFDALVAAGKASLKLGDSQSAAGFFGRAQEVNANSPLPLIGMGAALVATGDPQGALTYFAQAQRLGASVASFGSDRGLAYDLLGKQVVAQTDYRAALNGPDRDEARRRLSLSLAISGKKALALSTLEPLLQRRDIGAQRVRALILAVDGDVDGAEAALEYTMPGASARMDPFFRRLPTLSAVQKAAAVHLGIFPEGGVALASNSASDGDRLASIEELLTDGDSQPPQPQAPAVRYAYTPSPASAVAHREPPQVQVASVPRTSIARASPNNDLIQTQRVASDPGGTKIWLQLATGAEADQLPQQFQRIRARKPSLFTGLGGWVADNGSRSRLLIGPFHSKDDAQMFADALESAKIDAFSWTSQPGQVVRRLPTQ
jgi:Flp pilus assembly protein TadD/cell division septation protein DedD